MPFVLLPLLVMMLMLVCLRTGSAVVVLLTGNSKCSDGMSRGVLAAVCSVCKPS